ncbi:MAG: hypothetical protein ACE141_12860 [Bryobacteraceae bacterium]
MRTKLMWGLAAGLPLAMPAYGYTDPGSGLMLWQVLGAVFIGLMFHARRVVMRLWPRKRKDPAQESFSQ